MEFEQTSTIPLFLRRVRDSEKSPTTNTTKKLVFLGEGCQGGVKTVCSEIKGYDLPCSYTDSEMVLLSPSRKNQAFMIGMNDTQENHGPSLCNRIVKGSRLDGQRNTSNMATPLFNSPVSQCVMSQQNKESRNSVDPPNTNESVSKTSDGFFNPIPLDDEEQSKADDERLYLSPSCHPHATEKNSSSFLKVFNRAGSSGSTSDSDSSANYSRSGFFKTHFRYSSSSSGSMSDTSMSTTPGISPSGDFKELTWFEDPFSVKEKHEDMNSKHQLTPTSPGLSIDNELHWWSLSDKTSSPKIPNPALSPIEIEAKMRYERLLKQKQERQRKKEERFFF